MHRCCCRFSWILSIYISLPILASEKIDFAHDIVPILKANCVTCHGGREKEGDFSINTREDVIQSGMVEIDDAKASYLLDLITSEDPDLQMPPSDRPRLEPDEIELVRRWISEGLVWDADVSFEADSYEPPLLPRNVELPPVVQERDHPIDRLLDSYLAANRISVPEPIDDSTFARRSSLDLIGLLPTPDQLHALVNDAAPNKRSRWIDQLLDRKIDYADHWLTFFNDLLRNDYSGTGFITGGRKQVSKWLYESLVKNKPFDQMTRELVAPPSGESQGFINGIKWRGNVSAGQTIPIQFSQSISQTFLGINMKCASCHDSFIDRWTLKDAYGLGAIYADSPLELHRCDKPTGKTQDASWLFPELGQIDARAARDERLRQLASLLTHPQNGRFARTIVNRIWHQMMGRGIVHPLDAMQSKPWNEDLLDFLANHFVETGYDLKATMRLIANSSAYQSECEVIDPNDRTGGYQYRGPQPRRMTAEQIIDSVWQLTDAAPKSFDAPVFRSRVTEAEVEAIKLEGQWIWGPTNNGAAPQGETLLIRKVITLPAAAVGGGIVATCDNEFTLYINNKKIASGNDWTRPQAIPVKGLMKKGDSVITARVKNTGPKNVANAAGLFFEARILCEGGTKQSVVSDSTWQYHTATPNEREGRLRPPGKGWKSVSVLSALPVWKREVDNKVRQLIAITESPANEEPMVRASLLKNTPLMQSLGRPIRDQIVSMRPSELTTLEAIDLANETTFAETLKQGAEKWLNRDWNSTEDLVENLFLASLSRLPSGDERNLFLEFLGENPTESEMSDALWAIVMLPEFLLNR